MSENYFYSSLSGQEIEDTLVGAVRFNAGQPLSTSQKAQARQNIGAGAENTGFRILGYFDTLEDLQEYLQLPPQAGDAYGIGTSVPYDIYVWDAANEEWVDNGPLDIAEFIDDSETSSILTWSSQKINNEIASIDLTSLISDSTTAANKTWSSQKIDAEITAEITAVTALHLSGTVTAFPFTISNAAITATMRVAECTFGTPSAVQSDVAWTTTAGSIELSGTLASGGSTTVDLILVETREV